MGGGKVWYGSHVVEMEVERREEGGEEIERKRERHSRTDHIPFQATKQHEGKKYDMYTYLIPTSYKSVQRYKYIHQRYLPQPSLLDITPTLAFNIHITTRSHYTYLHLVLSIIIIPYNNTDKPGR